MSSNSVLFSLPELFEYILKAIKDGFKRIRDRDDLFTTKELRDRAKADFLQLANFAFPKKPR